MSLNRGEHREGTESRREFFSHILCVPRASSAFSAVKKNEKTTLMTSHQKQIP